MILSDSVRLETKLGELIAEVPAHVGVQVTAARLSVDNRRVIMTQDLTVILPAGTPWDEGVQIRWRGDLYSADSKPVVARRRGRDHHLTVKVTRQ